VTRSLIAIAATLCALAGPSALAQADDFGIAPGSYETSLSTNQAGAHPDLNTKFEINVDPENHPLGGTVKDLKFDLPKGLVGAAGAAPTCPINMVLDFEDSCPLDTAVGRAIATYSSPTSSMRGTIKALVYNVTPTADEPVALALNALYPIRLDVTARSEGDYGITATASNLSEAVYIIKTELTLWGVPADHNGPGPETDAASQRSFGGPGSGPRRAFMTNPTECSGAPLASTVAIDSWQHPGAFATTSFDLAPITGCDLLVFGPNADLRPDTRLAGAPAGFDLDLTVPQNPDPDGLATPDVKDIRLQLPEGVTLSPSAADGLGSCSDEQFGLGSSGEARCPPAAKIATVALGTPLLGQPLQGAVYLGSQLSGDPLSGRMVRLFLVAQGSGLTIRLPGSLVVDPASGRLTASFEDNPQIPLEALHLAFNGGPRALLTTPGGCGTYTSQAQITPWSSDVAAQSNSSFTIDGNCSRASQFTPSIEAGVINPVAGKSSSFVFQVSREDGQQNIARVQAELPAGELAKLAGVPLCGDAEAATGSCGPASKIGTATIAVGPGANPLYVPQPGRRPAAIYLAGPYRGAGHSMVIEVPAQAGPFDLGQVAVRAALRIDPRTTRVTIDSDPLPQFLKGVPLSYRTLYLSLDRRGFMQSPTSCEATTMGSKITSAQGAVANPSVRFQVGECDRLGFKPKLDLGLSGPTHRGAFPKLRATVTARRGDANIGRATVTLPKTEYLDSAHIRGVCSRAEFAALNCPASSVYGYARAWSPLLDRPLHGPVYLRSSSHQLPDLVASLDGQIQIDLEGRIDSVRARLRATFEALPDAPLSKFVLALKGGAKGLLVNNTELCKVTPRASVRFVGQNGKRSDSTPVVATSCENGGARERRNR
jgi:hypothetical protein